MVPVPSPIQPHTLHWSARIASFFLSSKADFNREIPRRYFFASARRATIRQLELLCLTFPPCRIRVCCQIAQHFKKRRRLADEKPVRGKRLDCSHCSPFCFGWTNDRTHRELSAEERAWLRHDQIGLEILPAERRRVKVRKRQSRVLRVGQGSDRRRHCCPRFVMPNLEVGLSQLDQCLAECAAPAHCLFFARATGKGWCHLPR